MAFGPVLVHPEKHLHPVLRLGAARAGVQRHDRRAVVVFPGKKRLHQSGAQIAIQRLFAFPRLVHKARVVRFLGHFD